jgi:DNA-binding response OmpR family regulator
MQSRTPDQGLAAESTPICFGPLCLNPEGFSVSVGERDVALTLAEFLLFQELARHPFQVLDRQRLVGVLRESIASADAAPSSSRAVDTHISRLRAKLRRAGYDCIKTMRFVGYRFVPV